ncbi:MAG: flippase-like domain-containing protein [Alphaproteobacteria bacterium]|nr:flippase-like domain-containing protein [Alphaproteobacteria bacterium]MCB9691666.1 flippase-like domain-containing protein [Alphaproteobacteria bacterium]
MEDVPAAEPGALASFRRWAAIAVALSAILYIAYALYKDLPGTAAELASFSWPIYAGVLALTLVNYGLRYLKWHFLLGRLGVHIPHSANLWIFGCGLAMVISPAKAGEVVKPYLVRVIAGTPMQRTLPALVAERVTDGIAVVALATLGITTFAPERKDVIFFAVAVLGSGFLVLLNQRVSMAILKVLGRIPVVDRVAGKLEEAYVAMRVCLAPVPLAITVAMSFAAWFAECVGLWLVYMGLHVDAGLEVSTFLYAFSTTAGGFSPGGLGVTDVVLGELGQALIPSLTEGAAVAASLLIRIATLWFGVILGALALLRIHQVIETHSGAAR